MRSPVGVSQWSSILETVVEPSLAQPRLRKIAGSYWREISVVPSAL